LKTSGPGRRGGAEGFERGGDKEFRQFLAQAKGSTGEVKIHLYVALDVGYLSQPKFDELYRLAAEGGRLVGGFMRYLSRSSLRGSKYRKSATQDLLCGPKFRRQVREGRIVRGEFERGGGPPLSVGPAGRAPRLPVLLASVGAFPAN
jgi:hypothetical protein